MIIVYQVGKLSVLKTRCDDLSDQIFENNLKCDASSNIYKYQELFCTEEMIKYDDKNLCNDQVMMLYLMSKYGSEDWLDYSDPHNCTGSCAEPGPGCDTCTNSEYFHCKRNNVSVCMHPDLECDGHPHCDDAEDENIDNCYSRYVEGGTVANYATFKCRSAMYPNMITLATVCDSTVECHNMEDELNCANTSPIWFSTSIIIITILYTLLEIKRKFPF